MAGRHHQPDRALRDRLPEHTFVEADELGPADAPAAVVFMVSAIAPMTESDCALIDFAAKYTDLVVGVVSKIDAHRNWREVLAADRALLAPRAPRYAHVQWVGVAAAPDLGEPHARRARRPVAATVGGSRCGAPKPVARLGNPAAHSVIAGTRPTVTGPTAEARVTRAARRAATTSCVAGGCRRPSAPSRCAVRSSRRGCSSRTSRATVHIGAR